jgi:UDP-N-acetylglucosamine acyltransferase
LGDRVLVSGNCVVHQFDRIGRFAMMRGMSRTSRDIPPFCIADLTHTLRGINIVGMKRAGFDTRALAALRRAFKTLFGTRRNLSLALDELAGEDTATPEVAEMIEFIRASRRGVAFGPRPGELSVRNESE